MTRLFYIFFNNWHKFKRPNLSVQIKLPDINNVEKNTIVYIVNSFPELAEQYIEFLTTLNIDFDGVYSDLKLDKKSAEKYIISLKIQRYLDKLKLTKKDLTDKYLAGDEGAKSQIKEIDKEITKTLEKQNLLLIE